MKSYQTFIQFLQDNGYRQVFDQAFEAQSPGYRMDAHLWEILGGDEYIFGRIFDWEKTYQGRAFWSKVDEQWYSYSTKL